jgi:hypothetical protein
MKARSVTPPVLLLAGAFLIAGCATQPHSASAPADGTLLDKKFERAAQHYEKYQHEGQVVYCKKEKPITSSIPVAYCLSEPELREQVASYERWRNRAAPSSPRPGAGQGGIGG